MRQKYLHIRTLLTPLEGENLPPSLSNKVIEKQEKKYFFRLWSRHLSLGGFRGLVYLDPFDLNDIESVS